MCIIQTSICKRKTINFESNIDELLNKNKRILKNYFLLMHILIIDAFIHNISQMQFSVKSNLFENLIRTINPVYLQI